MLRLVQCITVFAAVIAAFSAPIASDPLFDDVQARAPDALRVSLRETGANSPNWHFALVVHGAAPLGAGQQLTAHELVVDTNNACMSYDSREAFTGQNHIKATANIIAGRERTTQALKDKLTTIFKGVAASNAGNMAVNANGGFMNCFDWAVAAVEGLRDKGYVSAAEAAPFRTYWNANQAAVKAATAANTAALCNVTTRGLNGKQSKACAMKPTNGKKPVAVPAPAGRPKPAAKPNAGAQQKAPARRTPGRVGAQNKAAPRGRRG